LLRIAVGGIIHEGRKGRSWGDKGVKFQVIRKKQIGERESIMRVNN